MNKLENTIKKILEVTKDFNTTDREIYSMVKAIDVIKGLCHYYDEEGDYEKYLESIRNSERLFSNFVSEITHEFSYGVLLSVRDILYEYFYADENDEVLVGVYETSREYGGGEEGGWYYTNYYHVESKRISYADYQNFKKDIERDNEESGRRYEHQGKLLTYLELFEGQHQKDKREYYS